MLDMDQDPHTAIHSSRSHHQLIPNVLCAEASYSSSVFEGWKSRGHNVTTGYIFTGVSSVKRDEETGLFRASGDSRKAGGAAGY